MGCVWGAIFTKGQGNLFADLWRTGPGGVLGVGKILEGGDFFWTSGRNDETKGKNSKQVNEFMLVFVNSEQGLISSVFPLLFAEPALSRIPQAASSLPAVLGPGHSPASRRTPRSPLLRLSCSLPATRRVRLCARQAAPLGSHTHPGLRRGEGVGEPPTRGKLPLGR